MKALEIVFKSGAVVTVDCVSAEATRSLTGSGFTRITWETAEGAKRRILSLNPEDVSALIVVE